MRSADYLAIIERFADVHCLFVDDKGDYRYGKFPHYGTPAIYLGPYMSYEELSEELCR